MNTPRAMREATNANRSGTFARINRNTNLRPLVINTPTPGEDKGEAERAIGGPANEQSRKEERMAERRLMEETLAEEERGDDERNDTLNARRIREQENAQAYITPLSRQQKRNREEVLSSRRVRSRPQEILVRDEELAQEETPEVQIRRNSLEDIPFKLVARMRKFSGKSEESVENFIRSFEEHADRGDWTNYVCRIMLSMCLEGAALKWYDGLNDDVRNDYVKTKKGLWEQFAMSIPYCMSLLRNLKRKERDTVGEYALEVSGLAHKVDTNMSSREKYGYFLNGLSKEHQKFLQRRCISSFEEAVELMKNRESADLSERIVNPPATVKMIEAKEIVDLLQERIRVIEQKQITEEMLKTQLEKFQKTILENANKGNEVSIRRVQEDSRRCYNCGMKGHLMRDCRKPRSGNSEKITYERKHGRWRNGQGYANGPGYGNGQMKETRMEKPNMPRQERQRGPPPERFVGREEQEGKRPGMGEKEDLELIRHMEQS